MLKHILILIFSLILYGCTQNHVLKEKAYPRFTFPSKSYIPYSSPCNYSFEMPKYAQVEEKNTQFNQKLQKDSCWINVVFPQYNGTIHMSYKYYPNEDVLTRLLEDSYRLTAKHMSKASFIRDSIIDKPDLKGLIYSVGGNAASEKQFILTDYKHKFVRGAMYFNNAPNYDSMQPVIQFIDSDIYHLISTFKFE